MPASAAGKDPETGSPVMSQSSATSGCSLEESCPGPKLKAFQETNPNFYTIAYINCSAEVKALREKIDAVSDPSEKQRLRDELAATCDRLTREHEQKLKKLPAKERDSLVASNDSLDTHIVTMNEPLDYPDLNGRMLRIFQENYFPPDPSGGPLASGASVPGTPRIGIVSFGSQVCGDPSAPGVYTRVANPSIFSFLGCQPPVQPANTLAPSITGTPAPGQPQPATGEELVVKGIGLRMRLLPAGQFLMGSPENETDRFSDELQHPVRITRPFFLGVFEVTQLTEDGSERFLRKAGVVQLDRQKEPDPAHFDDPDRELPGYTRSRYRYYAVPSSGASA